MKNWGVVVVLLLSVVAFAQDASQAVRGTKTRAGSRKVISLSGTMSQDGGMLLRDSNGKVWTLSNPEMLESYAGRKS